MTAEPTRPDRRSFSVDELNRFVPGLGTIMPDIGTRTWKLYYAAKAGNWAMARFQVAEIRGLMLTGALTRPRYEDDLKNYLMETFTKVIQAVEDKDFAAFEGAFREAVQTANDYHDGVGRSYIVWKLPDFPPPDLDLTPRE